MAFNILALSILSGAVQLVVGDGTTIVIPSITTRTPIGLLIIPGAQIGADQYISLGSKIQDESPYSLWLATVGKWLGNMVNPIQLPSLIEDAVHGMREEGLPNDAPIFLAAHSLGGTFLDMYVRENPKGVAGVILYSSYINKAVRLKDYPVPVLTVSGNQDGMCRVTRIAKDYGQLVKYTHKTPVVIVPGVNHSLVASGKMPELVEKYDLIADCTEEQAHSRLANVTNAFLIMNGPTLDSETMRTANATLERHVEESNDTAGPINAAFLMDKGGRASAVQITATLLSGITSDDINMNISGVAVSGSAQLLTTNPVATKTDNKTLTMTVPFYNNMPLNPLDIALFQQSPYEELVKTISEKRVKQYFPTATFSAQPRGCNYTNFVAIALAPLLLPNNYNYRYTLKGRQLKIADDVIQNNEVDWLLADLNWTYNNTDNSATVSAPFYNDGKTTGCKVLTTSRVLEWILIDSFKKQP